MTGHNDTDGEVAGMADADANVPVAHSSSGVGTAPGGASTAVRPQRPATLVFTQVTLLLQAFAAFFAVLALWGLARAQVVDVSPAALWGFGFGFVALLAYAAGQQATARGRKMGWALQLPMLIAGVVLPAIAIIGVVFLAIWIVGVRLGSKIDRERAERLAAAAEAGTPGPAGTEPGTPAAEPGASAS